MAALDKMEDSKKGSRFNFENDEKEMKGRAQLKVAAWAQSKETNIWNGKEEYVAPFDFHGGLDGETKIKTEKDHKNRSLGRFATPKAEVNISPKINISSRTPKMALNENPGTPVFIER